MQSAGFEYKGHVREPLLTLALKEDDVELFTTLCPPGKELSAETVEFLCTYQPKGIALSLKERMGDVSRCLILQPKCRIDNTITFEQSLRWCLHYGLFPDPEIAAIIEGAAPSHDLNYTRCRHSMRLLEPHFETIFGVRPTVGLKCALDYFHPTTASLMPQ